MKMDVDVGVVVDVGGARLEVPFPGLEEAKTIFCSSDTLQKKRKDFNKFLLQNDEKLVWLLFTRGTNNVMFNFGKKTKIFLRQVPFWPHM